MNFFSKKSNLLKSGFAVAAIALALTNYSQSNARGKSVSIVGVSEANADTYCNSAASKTCTFKTSDGYTHTTTNAENN